MTAIETTGEKARALVYALLVHLACIALMSFGLWWTRSTVVTPPPGQIIEATLVGAAQAPKPKAAKPKPTKPDPPKPEPPKPETKEDKPPEPPKPDTKEQERITALAAEKATEEKHEQEERHRREQQLLDDEQKKKDAADKKKKLEDEKKKQQADQQAKEQSDKQKKLDKQHMEELLEAEEAKTGGEGKDDSLLSQYAMAIQLAAFNNWMRPDSTQSVTCDVNIKQIPGGEVISANVVEPCRTDALTKQSIETAVLRAQPLPYKGYESVFRREIIFTFCYPREACPK